jgi:hypothetical protein
MKKEYKGVWLGPVCPMTSSPIMAMRISVWVLSHEASKLPWRWHVWRKWRTSGSERSTSVKWCRASVLCIVSVKKISFFSLWISVFLRCHGTSVANINITYWISIVKTFFFFCLQQQKNRFHIYTENECDLDGKASKGPLIYEYKYLCMKIL